MKFEFSIDELIVIVSALRAEYRQSCEGAIVARRKQSTANGVDAAREFLEMSNWFDERCEKCADLYKKIIDKNIVEDL